MSDLSKLRGKPIIGGFYEVNGVFIPNFLTYAGISKITKLVAGTITATEWKIGCLSGDVLKTDTLESHGWVEPSASTGYARQTTTIANVVDTELSSQPITAIEFNPVSFSCGAEDIAWDVSCNHLFCTMKDSGGDTTLISIGSVLPSYIRLLPGTNFPAGYRICFGA